MYIISLQLLDQISPEGQFGGQKCVGEFINRSQYKKVVTKGKRKMYIFCVG